MNTPVSGLCRLMPWSSRISPSMASDQFSITPPAWGASARLVALRRASTESLWRGTRSGRGSAGPWAASSTIASTSDSTTKCSAGLSGLLKRSA